MTQVPTAREQLVVADLQRQMAHWLGAATTFRDAEEFASEAAWRSVEGAIGMPLRRELGRVVEELIALGQAAAHAVVRARTDAASIPAASRAVQAFRRRYVAVETQCEYFGDAVNSRRSPTLRATLATLDRLAGASMAPVYTAAGLQRPPALVYVDKGMGASILRAGVRLWAPGSINIVAAIKIVRHNLYRPTSLFHETGHQVAASTRWVPALRDALATALADDPQLRSMWTAWASEIAADVFAFLHTGYASVCALYDVVGDERTILSWPLGDPHPIGWLRTLLGCEFARRSFGAGGPGQWDALEAAMLASHPVARAEGSLAVLLERSRARMPQIASACLAAPVPGLGGRPMTAILDAARVSPRALTELERAAGPALWSSPHWRQQEGIRIVALAGLREAERPETARQWIDRARSWMTSDAQAA